MKLILDRPTVRYGITITRYMNPDMFMSFYNQYKDTNNLVIRLTPDEALALSLFVGVEIPARMDKLPSTPYEKNVYVFKINQRLYMSLVSPVNSFHDFLQFGSYLVEAKYPTYDMDEVLPIMSNEQLLFLAIMSSKTFLDIMEASIFNIMEEIIVRYIKQNGIKKDDIVNSFVPPENEKVLGVMYDVIDNFFREEE